MSLPGTISEPLLPSEARVEEFPSFFSIGSFWRVILRATLEGMLMRKAKTQS